MVIATHTQCSVSFYKISHLLMEGLGTAYVRMLAPTQFPVQGYTVSPV